MNCSKVYGRGHATRNLLNDMHYECMDQINDGTFKPSVIHVIYEESAFDFKLATECDSVSLQLSATHVSASNTLPNYYIATYANK